MRCDNNRSILSRAVVLGFSVVALFGFGQAGFAQTPNPQQQNCAAPFFQAGLSAVQIVASEWIEASAHCRVTGLLEQRVSDVDQQTYAIGFELRLPLNWNQRFLFQGNGGNDGRVVPAMGASSNHSVSALAQGFAVISTDAGHQSKSMLGGAAFGVDPQARLDYGYRANEKLTPLAKQLIARYYQQAAKFSYFFGCSNGGRHAMVAASRLAAEFDGFVAGNPGFNLPKAAIQHAWDVQTLSALNDDLSQSLSTGDLNIVAKGVLDACDNLDGAVDGMAQSLAACQVQFSLKSLSCPANTVDSSNTGPSNSGPSKIKENCLPAEKIAAIDKLFSGPVNSKGEHLYSDWPFDAGLSGADWRRWKIQSPIANLPMIATLGSGSLAYIFTTPPTVIPPTPPALLRFLREFNFDRDAAKITATTDIYRESAMDFMTPPQPHQLSALAASGGKLLVYHGASDGVFSVSDTIRWYQQLDKNHQGKAADFARLFVVPGMNHCAGGPATDQFDALTAVVNWVELRQPPVSILASVNANNPEIPEGWSKNRTRPLCAFPKSAVYRGRGDVEEAGSFFCD